ncbi:MULTISPECIES: hypothetical protein [Butyricimonas]|uniref:hypothetical protein n=1 Tax=Butyricimonas TaxID=574697 RepID=UPI0007FB3085|nr:MULTISPECIES: hypothetical protein [Butyricimonas]
MKTRILVISLLCLLGFAGCEEDDALAPSYKDRNWLTVEDDSNDPLTHLRYRVYTEQGVNILYNDTLGSEERYDSQGNLYTYYEVWRPGYAISSNSVPKYVLPDDRADVLAMAEMMDKYLFDYLRKDKRPLVYFLVDTLRQNSSSATTPPERYLKFLTTVCVGRIEEARQMSDSAQKSFMAELAGLEYVDDLKGCELNTDLSVEYDSIRYRVQLSNDYSPVNWYKGITSKGTSTVRKVPEPELFGFLFYSYRTVNRIYAPSDQQDKASYIGLILSCTDAEIRERYKKYPAVIARYEVVREMMVNAGILEK